MLVDLSMQMTSLSVKLVVLVEVRTGKKIK